MVRDLDRKMIEKFVTRKFGEQICELDSSEKAKMWRHLCSIWLLTKGWGPQMMNLLTKPVEWLILWIPFSLFPQQHFSSPSGLMFLNSLIQPTRSSPSWSSWFDSIVKWHFEDSTMASARWQHIARTRASFSKRVLCVLNQHPKFGVVSPIARIHGSRNQRVEMGMAPLLLLEKHQWSLCFLFQQLYTLLA